MKLWILSAAALVCSVLTPRTFALAPASDSAAKPPAPRIEVCFVLDTTGSMGGLIEGAKQKVWAIANEMVRAKPTPELKLALIAYRDRGDAYVTQRSDLTDDIDAVYGNLRELKADGGGDGPESVNQALYEAVHQIAWSPDRSVLKIIFLVGDAPPHMDYNDDVKYPRTCLDAVKKDLIVNAIQCGSQGDTTPIWQEISRLSEGSFVAIGQTGDVQAVATPLDAELARATAELNKTVVAYGGERQRREVAGKMAAAEGIEVEATADRAAFIGGIAATRPAGESGPAAGVPAAPKAITGRGDLVSDWSEGQVELDKLKEAELPAEMRKLDAKGREAYLKEHIEQRKALQAKVEELSRKRQSYIDEEHRKRAEGGAKDGFDAQVGQMLREQAKRKGIRYEAPATQPNP